MAARNLKFDIPVTLVTNIVERNITYIDRETLWACVATISMLAAEMVDFLNDFLAK